MTLPNQSATAPAAPSSPRAVLAIDYGRRRFGLALSDVLGLTARPLAVFQRTNRRNDITRLRDLCRRHEVGRIVVGWPVRLDGTPGDMAKEAAAFAERLRKQLGRHVDLVDERLSSWEAEQQLHEWGVIRLGQSVDDLAAAIILRDYLARSQKSDSPAGIRLLPAAPDQEG
jgi:putative holliday junction resolvase